MKDFKRFDYSDKTKRPPFEYVVLTSAMVILLVLIIICLMSSIKPIIS